ncbi:TPA: DNA cytosine methyltransferase [Pseudomonas aeruginosa]|uniref:DNA cytosine methyltransferase n=1 Tax=Pseudomonas aeruginosa TaxID=287 RepID=UPI0008FB428D|nr:DNA (cytosine-5-)-methyltransferase [Pseudomonas aeruginosa]EIU3791888.1 DNA (cytosine-5-)-methyltransferase [Pseudomonas aeruginosa]EKV0488503.1 DNA (cytosine-5-)-methyltransferase [Pseudomonas aeruginosa]MBI7139111.1 DNA (cytosine-5-)-methyltransferase [Pseudomonas aeruginosa]MCO5378582.1 DNA cytosine methyltransferase [Pseudomonas aeruginosa]MCV0091740.1 DNA cytosine methyltransferase [Pseudomonas aeruginosa]
MENNYSFFEFFAGGGMARAGLGDRWQCLFANDMDVVKASTYIRNWGAEHFDGRDIREVNVTDLKGCGDLAWASFPCQDLSVAGNGLGMGESGTEEFTRSGALWPFLDLIDDLRLESRQPHLLVLENVVGLLTLEQGRDFAAICLRLGEMKYRYGAVIIDAKTFLPQSRPRVFIIAVRNDIEIPCKLSSETATDSWHAPTLIRAYKYLPSKAHGDWIWWDLGPAPLLKKNALEDLIRLNDAEWHAPEETQRFINMMTPLHLARLEEAKNAENFSVGSLYLRMRREGNANKQRAEVTFSPILGCLRTPRGGASRSRIIVAGKGQVRTRLLSISEAAALMGLDHTYTLPDIYHHAFKVIGDGVAVPSVRFLADRLLEPLILAARKPAVPGSEKRPDKCIALA